MSRGELNLLTHALAKPGEKKEADWFCFKQLDF